ncbi:MAG TPA: S53 family peptidase [Chloroflexia bacterium]|nr:S53 family peptidase [Chloroflexia bacterium]
MKTPHVWNYGSSIRQRMLASMALMASMLLSLFSSGPIAANAASNVQLSNNVAPWVANAQLKGRSDLQSRVTISVYLQLQNEAGLRNFIQQLYTPGSTQYGHFLTPDQFRAAYSPSASTLSQVQAFLGQKGLKVEYTPANGMYVDASGTVNQLESAFNITENQYIYNGKELRANAQAPTIPASLASAVSFIGGLDESEALVQPRIKSDAPPGVGYATPGPCSTYWGDQTGTVNPSAYQYGPTLPWQPCGYTPQQIRAAYGVDATGLTGKGVRVGITDAFASPTIVDDVNRFSANHGLPLLDSTNFQQIVVPGTYNAPENRFDPAGWYGEESLDIEWVHSIAPEATIVYAGSQNSNAPLDHALIHMIDNHLVDIVSNSWGYEGEPSQYGHIQADERAFMQAAAEGISVLFSSGDDGDAAAFTGIAGGSWPATSPFVTAVGGTSLAVNNASGAKNEWGWGTYRSVLSSGVWSPWAPTYQYGSGGGLSLNFAQPFYQKGVVPQALANSTTTASGQTINFSTPRRVTPDISMVGDPNTGALYGQTYDVSGDPLIDQGCTPLPHNQEYCERRIGGTSLSSPLFAGMLALVNQARFQSGKGPVGFVNPALYKQNPGSGAISDVLPPSAPTAVLRNVGDSTGLTLTLRTINSVPTGTNGPVIEGADSSLRTTRGYDNVTGLGTPEGTAFVKALSQ